MSQLLGRTVTLGALIFCINNSYAFAEEQNEPLWKNYQYAQTTPQKTEEVVFWESVKDSNSPDELRAYLKTFPNGVFAPLAKIRLEKLTGAKESGAPEGNSPPSSETPPNQAGQSDKPQNTSKNTAAESRAESKIPPLPSDYKKAGYMGVRISNANSTDGKSGVKIEEIFSNSPAEGSTLRKGDILTDLDGAPITGAVQFTKLVGSKQPGTLMKISAERHGQTVQVEFKLGDRFVLMWENAHKGDSAAMNYLGWAYAGNVLLGRDYAKSRDWLERAGAAGSGSAYYKLGTFYTNGEGVRKHDHTAFSYFLKGAELGDGSAQQEVAYSYAVGRGVAKDPAKSIPWYRKAADQGVTVAMVNLGRRYQSGNGVDKDMKEAGDWYEKAAKAGNAEAYSGLGFMYKFGHGGRPKDIAEAIRLFRKGIDAGEPYGYYNLGLLYEEGTGVIKDRNEAIRLYRKALAIAPNMDWAIERLKTLKVPPYDLAEIQRLLSNRGYDPGPADGKMGSKTRQAIRLFQKQVGLPQTGNASVELAQKLKSSDGAKPGTPVAGPANASPAAPKAPQGDLSDLDAF